MKMDFHATGNKTSYTGRGASREWRECILGLVDIRDKAAADIGCGGGIYSRALVELGAAQVTAVDFSTVMLDGARDYCASCATMHDAIVDGKLAHLGDSILTDAVASATRRRLGDRWAWKRTSEESPITPLVAASLALWGAISVAPKPTPQVF